MKFRYLILVCLPTFTLDEKLEKSFCIAMHVFTATMYGYWQFAVLTHVPSLRVRVRKWHPCSCVWLVLISFFSSGLSNSHTWREERIRKDQTWRRLISSTGESAILCISGKYWKIMGDGHVTRFIFTSLRNSSYFVFSLLVLLWSVGNTRSSCHE